MKKTLLFLLLTTVPAFAHTRLVSCAPAANSTGPAPGLVKMTFSENLEPAFSGAVLRDAKGKTVPVSTSVGGATITLLPLALKPGLYKIFWHSVGHDTHRMQGSFAFTVVP